MTNLGISPGEFKVLLQCIQGLSSKQAGESLCVTEGTIKFHRSKMLKKLGFKSMNQLLILTANLIIKEIVWNHLKERKNVLRGTK